MKRSFFVPLYWFVVLLIWELNLYWTASSDMLRFLPGLGFTLAYAAVLTVLVHLPGWAGRILGWVVPPLLALIYAVQLVYYEIFGSFLSLAFVSAGGDAVATFSNIMFAAIWRRLPQLLLIFVPVIAFYFLRYFRILPRDEYHWKILVSLFVSAVYIFFGVIMCLPSYGDKPNQPAALLGNPGVTIDRWAEHFGIITAEALDLKRQGGGAFAMLRGGDKLEIEEPESWNIVDEMDFTALDNKTDDPSIQNLNQYFSSLEPTNKNEYTGMFEGYNLIVICAEAFSNYVIDPELTPTLYRMSQEGIVFENFYNSFPNLTTNGEYSLCTGLMPDLSRMSFAVSVDNYLPYALGNICAENGMTALAYHNNVGTFYNRVNTHSNLGYDFRAVGFGLDIEPGTPTSDLEMIEETMDDYLKNEPFHAYYMTYSGHSDYDFAKNDMSAKNRSLVEKLPYSKSAKAYIACQLELEKAMTVLLDKLEKEGIADRTMVVLTGDHMPYGLPEASYAELAGEEAVKQPFWEYKNSFLCWTGGLDEPVIVDDYCCTMDILPTVLNLLGVTYDSRLLTGRDVLSETTHMALLKDGSFLTKDVVYDANTDTFTWSEEESAELGESLLQYAADQFAVSAAILDTDYYDFAFRALQLSQGREDRETVASYADISGAWFEQAVELLNSYGALSGVSTGSFNGRHPATRADFVAMLTRAKGLIGSSGSHAYEDVENDIWYHDILNAAVEAGLIKRAKNFRPSDEISVEEATIILTRACEDEEWVQSTMKDALRKQKEDGYTGLKNTLSRGATAWLVAMVMDKDALDPLTFEPEPAPVWIPTPAPEPEGEPEAEIEEETVPWIPPPDPLG